MNGLNIVLCYVTCINKTLLLIIQFYTLFPVVSGFSSFIQFYPLLSGFIQLSSSFLQLNPVLSAFIKFYPVNQFYPLSLVFCSLIRFDPVLSGLIQFDPVFIQFHPVSSSISSGSIQFYPVISGYERVLSGYIVLSSFIRNFQFSSSKIQFIRLLSSFVQRFI